MIGRSEDVDRIGVALGASTNIVLAGPRRIGKTTVADAALETLAAGGTLTAAVDLFHIPDSQRLAEELTRQLVRHRPPLSRALAAAGRTAAEIREALSVTATLRARQDLGDGIDVVFGLGSGDAEAPHAELVAAFELCQRVADAENRQLVVFFDEFQDIASGRFGDVDTVTRLLRSVLQRSPSVSVLFAGSVQHLMRDLFAPGDRALSQFGSLYELHPITAEEWQAGITDRLAADGCEIDRSALGRLIEFGAGHPRATMLACQQAHLISVERVEHRIDDAIALEAMGRAMRADRLKHEQALREFRSFGRNAEGVATRVARGEPPYRGVAPQSAKRALDRLRDAGYLDQRGDRWVVVDPLLGRYLAALP